MDRLKRAVTYASSEESEQEAVVRWCAYNHIPVVHIPNEGKRSTIAGARLKRVGMAPGFPDLFFPVARGGKHGLMIEMKTVKGKPSDAQKEWIAKLRENGYAAGVCHGADHAIRTIENYMEGET